MKEIFFYGPQWRLKGSEEGQVLELYTENRGCISIGLNALTEDAGDVERDEIFKYIVRSYQMLQHLGGGKA